MSGAGELVQARLAVNFDHEPTATEWIARVVLAADAVADPITGKTHAWILAQHEGREGPGQGPPQGPPGTVVLMNATCEAPEALSTNVA